MIEIHPVRIPGRWVDGRALDVHTVSSTYLGEDEFGHTRFETTRSEMRELLYRLKYRGDRAVVTEIAEAAAAFVRGWQTSLEVLWCPYLLRASEPCSLFLRLGPSWRHGLAWKFVEAPGWASRGRQAQDRGENGAVVR